MATRVFIGKDMQTGQAVAIDAYRRARSTYVLGIQGTGKSTLLEQIVYQDMVNGDGLIFIDPHGDSATTILERVPRQRAGDVIYFDIADQEHLFALNPFSCSNPQDIDRTAGNFLAALEGYKEYHEAFENAPLMKDVLRHLAFAFILNPGRTLAEASSFLLDYSVRKTFYPNLTGDYAETREYWEDFDRQTPQEQRRIISSSLNKLRPLSTARIMRRIFGQPNTTIDIGSAMMEGKAIIVRLSDEAGPDAVGFIGAFLIWEVLKAARARAYIPAQFRRPFHVIADEFHTFLTTAFPVLQAQARKYGVDTTIAHQIREQLQGDLKELTRAVGNHIIFRVTQPNASSLAGEFDTTPPPAEMVLKPVTQRELLREAVYDMQWTDPEKEAEYQQMEGERGDLNARLAILREFYPPFDTRGIEVSYREDIDPQEEIVYRRYHPFNPDLADDRVKALLTGAESVRLPQDLPYTIESKLGRLAENPEELTYHWDDLSARETALRVGVVKVKQFARDVLSELAPLLSQVKAADGPYRFVPHAYYEFAYVPYKRLRYSLGGPQVEYEVQRPTRIWLGYGYFDVHPRPEMVFWLEQKMELLNRTLGELQQKMEEFKGAHYKDMEVAPPLYDDKVIAHQLMPGPTRHRSDVEHEIANELAKLPDFEARCKIGTQQFTIQIEPLDVPRELEQAEEIKRRSQARYGLPSQLPSPSARIEEEDGKPVGDDTQSIVFGEKKTASQSRKSPGGGAA